MSLVGCSPWGCEESDTTERLHSHFSLSCIGEGNGNPLQCSCLENPRDGGAWWAVVYGVAQSQTRLKWLNGSSSSETQEFALDLHLYFVTATYTRTDQGRTQFLWVKIVLIDNLHPVCVCVCVCVSCSVVPNSLWLHGLCWPGSSVHRILQARKLEWAASPFSRRSSWFRDRNCSPALQADSLPSERPRKPSTYTLVCTNWHCKYQLLRPHKYCWSSHTEAEDQPGRATLLHLRYFMSEREAASSYGSGYQGEKGEVQLKELAKFLFKWEISSGFQYLRQTLSFV